MKKIVSTLLSLALCFSILSPVMQAKAAKAEPDGIRRQTISTKQDEEILDETQEDNGDILGKFPKKNEYLAGQFSDVSADNTFASNVQLAYEYGIMNGKSHTFFDTTGQLTIAQSIAMACRIHSTYFGNEIGQPSDDAPWYQSYVVYALANSIIDSGYSAYDVPISRAGFASILYRALPAYELQVKNSIEEQSIPDVDNTANYAPAVYALYKAGVLTGNDSKGTFTPFAKITRGAAAAIVSRMVDPTLRKNIGPLYKCVFPTAVYTTAELHLYVGETRTLPVSFAPDTVTEKNVTWSSSNPKVATVSQSGVVTAVGKGTAMITIKTENGVTTGASVSVMKKESVEIYGTSIDCNSVGGISPTIYWRNNSTKTIKYVTFTVTPYNAVWDPVRCSIRGYSTHQLQVTGPVAPFTTQLPTFAYLYHKWEGGNWGEFDSVWGTYPDCYINPMFYYGHGRQQYNLTESDYSNICTCDYWDCVWYNGNIDHILVSKIYIQYMDGTTETIKNPTIRYD